MERTAPLVQPVLQAQVEEPQALQALRVPPDLPDQEVERPALPVLRDLPVQLVLTAVPV